MLLGPAVAIPAADWPIRGTSVGTPAVGMPAVAMPADVWPMGGMLSGFPPTVVPPAAGATGRKLVPALRLINRLPQAEHDSEAHGTPAGFG